jgi:cytochrome c-type biogenesis protein
MEALAWIGGAFWLGLLTAISPCPLTANLAAIGFLGRDARSGRVVAGGLLYAAGRSLAYIGLAALLGWGLLSAPGLSRWLQTVLSPLLGPLLLLTGAALLGWLPLPSFGAAKDEAAWQRRRERWGLAAALPMGLLFALAFCPVSAALFFGSLLPLAVGSGQPLLAPLIYGIGTALPVAAFAVAMALGADAVGRLFARSSSVELWMRRLTAIFLITLGIVLLWTRIWAPLLGW